MSRKKAQSVRGLNKPKKCFSYVLGGERPCTCELKLWARAQLSFPNHAAGWWGFGAGILGYFYGLSVMGREVSLFSLLVITFEVSEGQLIKHSSTVEMLLRKRNFVTLDSSLLAQVPCT